MKRTRRGSSYNFWPCVSDLMLATFMFVLLLWLSAQISSAKLIAATRKPLPKPVAATPAPMPPTPVDPDEYKRLIKRLAELEKENSLLRKRAPKVDLAEAKGFSFNKGTVVLSDQASNNFDDAVIRPLQKQLKEHRHYVDTIEIIGYTDEQPVAGSISGLDTLLPATMEGVPLEKVHAGSNADLGLLRAVAIMQRLREEQKQGRLDNLPIRVYSAAQVNPPDLPAPIDARILRRMEIRLTRLKDAAASDAPKADK